MVGRVRKTLTTHNLNTVCNEAKCPNRADCFGRGTATFLILGDRCTRDCRFCAVAHLDPVALDPSEPAAVANAAKALGLNYVVVTSVTRDDLPDGGAAHFAETVGALRRELPDAGIEVLVPDFRGDASAVDTVLAARPDVFGHNIETVERLYADVRAGADYWTSLGVLSRASGERELVKSAIMLGVGETDEEIRETLMDLRSAGVAIVYIGQYLRPTPEHHGVERYVTPLEFEKWERVCVSMGFAWVSSGPFVRSSYEADTAFARVRGRSWQQGRDARKER
jgi:lipoic acid synthetase